MAQGSSGAVARPPSGVNAADDVAGDAGAAHRRQEDEHCSYQGAPTTSDLRSDQPRDGVAARMNGNYGSLANVSERAQEVSQRKLLQ